MLPAQAASPGRQPAQAASQPRQAASRWPGGCHYNRCPRVCTPPTGITCTCEPPLARCGVVCPAVACRGVTWHGVSWPGVARGRPGPRKNRKVLSLIASSSQAPQEHRLYDVCSCPGGYSLTRLSATTAPHATAPGHATPRHVPLRLATPLLGPPHAATPRPRSSSISARS